jgi:hypothetical protein
MDIADNAGRRVGYLAFDLGENEFSGIIILKVRAGQDWIFRASSNPRVEILARRTGSGESFEDLAGGVNLSGFTSGEFIAFDIRAHAKSFDGRFREAITLAVIKTGAAAWQG